MPVQGTMSTYNHIGGLELDTVALAIEVLKLATVASDDATFPRLNVLLVCARYHVAGMDVQILAQ
jgi:hypothetical protein